MATDTIEKIEIRGYPQQMEFIHNTDFEGAFIGGVDSGKTYAGTLKTLKYCLQNPGAWGIISAPQNRILEERTIPIFGEVFPERYILSKKARPHHVWELVDGCRLLFWSTEKPETIAAVKVAFVNMDEGSLSPERAYLNFKKRLSQKDKNGNLYPAQLWTNTTPRQLNWLYKAINRDKNPMTMFHASTRDNIYKPEVEEFINRLGLTGKEYEQEVEGKFVLLAGECLFTQETLEMQLRNCEEPIDIRDNGMAFIWREPIVGVKYIAAADCADEGGGGVNDLIIQDSQTGEEMAEINADIAADKFADIAYDLLREYNSALFAPERNGTVGGIVLQKLKDMGYNNLYRDDKGKEGWYTTSTAYPPKVSRFTMLKEYEEAIRLRRTIVRSSDAVGEMSTFVRDEGGKYQPRQGYKSDRVMSRAICWQLRKVKQTDKVGFTSFKRQYTSYE